MILKFIFKQSEFVLTITRLYFPCCKKDISVLINSDIREYTYTDGLSHILWVNGTETFETMDLSDLRSCQKCHPACENTKRKTMYYNAIVSSINLSVHYT